MIPQKTQIVKFSLKKLWRWGELSPRAEGYCIKVYVRIALWCFKLKNYETRQIFFNRVPLFCP